MYYYVFYLKRWATWGLSIPILVLTWADYSECVLKPIYGSFLSPFGLVCVLSTCFLVVLQLFPPSHLSGKQFSSIRLELGEEGHYGCDDV